MGPAGRDQRTESFTVVNAAIHDLADDLERNGEPLEWRFWCECGAPACAENVWLTLAAYEALRDQRRPVLAPGHELDQRARARRLADDAAALVAQAEHQAKRAARNRARFAAPPAGNGPPTSDREPERERPDDGEPWAKTSSGDADSVTPDDDEDE